MIKTSAILFLIFISVLVFAETTSLDSSRKQRYTNEFEKELIEKEGVIKGNRLTEDVKNIIIKNRIKLYHAYNNAIKNGLKGKAFVFVKITISSSGRVLDADILKKDYNFPTLDKDIINEILKWDFGKTKPANDTTEIQYFIGFHQ